MPIEQFSYVKPSVSQREGVVPVHQAWGDRVHAVDRVGSAGGDIKPAGLYSTAPYVDEQGVAHPNPQVQNIPEPPKPKPSKCTATRADGEPCVQPEWRDGLCTRHAVLAQKAEVADGRPESA